MTTNKAPGFEEVVADASLIISLERLLPLGVGAQHLQMLFGRVLLPEKAMQEVLRHPKVTQEVYLQRHQLHDVLEVVAVTVDPALIDIQRLYDGKKDQDYEGEAYAIALAVQRQLRIILDDTTAVPIAVRNGLKPYNLGTGALRAFAKQTLSKADAETLLLAGRTANMYSERVYQRYLVELVVLETAAGSGS